MQISGLRKTLNSNDWLVGLGLALVAFIAGYATLSSDVKHLAAAFNAHVAAYKLELAKRGEAALGRATRDARMEVKVERIERDIKEIKEKELKAIQDTQRAIQSAQNRVLEILLKGKKGESHE